MNQFHFRVFGQVPSWNKSYRMRKANVLGKFGQPVIGDDLRQKTVSRLFKTDEARTYQDGVQLIARAAKPTAFNPQHQIIVSYQFHMARATDADNAMKMLNDAIAKALGVNDARFLPVTLTLESGCKDPYVSIFIYDADHWSSEVRPVR